MPEALKAGLKAGAIIGGASTILTSLPTGYASLVWPAAKNVMHLPSSQRLTAWLPALGHAMGQWSALHAYYPWTAWILTAQHPPLVGVALGLSSLIGLLVGIKIAHDNGGFSLFGGPSATGKGEHGTAHWRPFTGPGGIQEGYATWVPPKKSITQAIAASPIRKALERPRSKVALPAPVIPPAPTYESVVASQIADRYHHGLIPPADPDAQRPPKAPETVMPSGLVVGLTRQKPSQGAYVLDKDEHVVIIGSPGSGKTRRLLLPTIGVVGSAKKESLIISDVKGELYQHSATWLQSQGYVVNRIDLRQHPNPGSQHFNPILAVRDALLAKDWSLGTSLAQSIAHILVASNPDAENVKDPFWPQTEMSLITAVILALAEWAPAEQAHLYSLFTTLAESPDGSLTDKWFDDPDRYPPGHAAKLAYSATKAAGKAEQTRAGIFTGAQAALRLFGLPEIAAMTATSDHDLADSGRELTATFLVVPWHDASRNSIVGLYLSLAVQALAELAERNTGRLPVPVLFLLDEFGNFPAIPNFPTLITVARSAGMRFLMAVQHLEQVEKRYPKAAETITGSANTWVFLRSQGEKTPETISKMMGEYTLSKASTTSPKVSFFNSTTPGAATESNQLSGRRLVTMDEVLRWPLGQALVMQSGYAPARLSVPDLSGWQAVFPGLQTAQPDPAPAPPATPPPIWDLDAALAQAQSGGGGAQAPADQEDDRWVNL